MNAITPCLWFNGDAEAAAELYTGLFPDSGIDAVGRYGEGMPFPAGTALMVEFHLGAQRMQALNGGPHYTFSEAVSLSVKCATQAEVDHYWDGLITGGGSESMCGWCKDRFGLSWQIVPQVLVDLQKTGDVPGIGRMFGAMMTMKRLDIAALEAAFHGDGT